MLKHLLKTIVTELAWRRWDLNPLLLFMGLQQIQIILFLQN